MSFQQRAIEMWRGSEKEGVVALVRALDTVAVTNLLGGSTRDSLQFAELMGAAAALKPFLSAIKDQPGGVPWGATRSDVARFAHSYLRCCGQLSHLRRMAALERYGLARSSITPTGILIESSYGAPELTAWHAMSTFKTLGAKEPLPGGESPQRELRRLRKRMREYVDVDPLYFIRYENDQKIVSAFERRARRLADNFLEREAFPDDVAIGGRTFSEWKAACEQATGRVLAHIEFASILTTKRPDVSMENILTMFARRDDVSAVWAEAGLRPERIEPTMDALTLEIDGLDDWENAYEIPCPFYVDLGKDFVLLPCFGALTNPYFALFRHLKSTYHSDWDRGVDRREAVFRSDLRNAFGEPRYLVPQNGFRLRRPDGSTLTDVDAVMYDRRSGTLVLVQLKWHDVFGLSLAERESRKTNIVKANEWVGRVSAWVNGRSSTAVAQELGLHTVESDKPPLLYVIARYSARFSGEHDQDRRATWVGWPEVFHEIATCGTEDPLAELPSRVSQSQSRFSSLPETNVSFRFPSLAVDLRISSPSIG